jgi:hypothetical protein
MKLLFILTFLLSSIATLAQINKGQFLVGGSGTYSRINYSQYALKYRTVDVNGRSGIFLLNKLAAGLRIGYTYTKHTSTTISDTTTQYYKQTESSTSIGPFIRYYIFSPKQKLNFLADASYFRNWSAYNVIGPESRKSYGYALAAGPALLLSPNVSLETTLNYEYNRTLWAPSAFRVKVGFQVHLSKAKQSK